MLAVQGLTKRFGGVTALSDVSLTVEHGQLLAIIGPNGAGKSTLFQTIALNVLLVWPVYALVRLVLRREPPRRERVERIHVVG